MPRNTRVFCFFILPAAIGASLLAAPAGAQIYKCVGTDGRASYVQTPDPARRCEAVDARAPPAGSSPHLESLQRFVIEADQANAAARKARAAREQQAAEQAEACRMARRQLALLDEPAATYYSIDENGERRTLSEEQRQQELRAAQERVQQACAP